VCVCRYYKTDIRGAADGRLAGRSVAVKDSIAVAGVPMMNGSRILEGFIPDIDATVVTRVLDAGKVYTCALYTMKYIPSPHVPSLFLPLPDDAMLPRVVVRRGGRGQGGVRGPVLQWEQLRHCPGAGAEPVQRGLCRGGVQLGVRRAGKEKRLSMV
jgi:hypothetical protein